MKVPYSAGAFELALAAAWLLPSSAFTQQRLVALDSAQVSMVWSGHPVDFALIERNDTLYAGYYAADPDRQMTIARRLPSGAWSRKGLDNAVGWDSHNYIAMHLDGQNRLHVSGNMHNVPLIYYRASDPGDIASLARARSMVGSRENSVTYPVFFRGPAGEFLFMYRDGGSGNGSQIVNAWDPQLQSWSRLLDNPLFDGQGTRSAYLGSPSAGPVTGPDGFFHLFWFWRSTPDASTTHHVGYIRSRDMVRWETATGAAVSLPIRFSTPGVTVDPVPEKAGLINRGQIGFDAQGRPVITYHKFDGSSQGYTQLYNARLENGSWKVYKSTDWTYRWNFGGQGSLIIEIEFGPVTVDPNGTLTQWYRHSRHGTGVLVLNPDNLHADQVRPDAYWPEDLEKARRSGMEVLWLQARSSSDPSIVHALRWETMPTNQDRPRSPIPAPTPLMWYRLRDPNVKPVAVRSGRAVPVPARVAAPRKSHDLLGRRFEASSPAPQPPAR
jgi:hypothetical protein